MKNKQKNYEPLEEGFKSWNGNELEEIEFRPKFIYYFTKHFFPFLFFLMTAFACVYVHDKYAKSVISLISMILMAYLMFRYISIMMCTKWTVTDKAIIIKKGVLVKTTNETELFRVIDFAEKQNIIQSIFNNTDLYVYSSDKTDPQLCIFGITKNKEIFNEIKRRVKVQRELNQIHETNINANTVSI